LRRHGVTEDVCSVLRTEGCCRVSESTQAPVSTVHLARSEMTPGADDWLVSDNASLHKCSSLLR